MKLASWLLLTIPILLLTACGLGAPMRDHTSAATANVDTITGATGPTATTGASGSTGRSSLTVFAAASLTGAFNEMGKSFEAANPGAQVAFNYAGSQALVKQIAQGAPADVFAAASGKQMDAAVASGRIDKDNSTTFARNRLVIVYPKANPAGIKAVEDLTKPGVKVDLAAKEVPAGQYSLDFLDAAANDPAYGESYKAGVLKNVVSYEENVKAVVEKVSLGEADAGIVYESDVAADTGKLGRVTIPEDLNQIATYPIAPLKDTKTAELASKFVDYVLSAQGQGIMKKHGFLSMEG